MQIGPLLLSLNYSTVQQVLADKELEYLFVNELTVRLVEGQLTYG